MMAASSGQTTWWCSLSHDQRQGFCDDNAPDCRSSRLGLMSQAPEFGLSECTAAATAACFHYVDQAGGQARDVRTCYPTMTVCKATRYGLYHLTRGRQHPRGECVIVDAGAAQR